jgi:FecR protein/Tetratricopeptide repeat
MSETPWRGLDGGGHHEGGDNAEARLLRDALGDARARLPDDVTMRRMWARVSEPEALEAPVPPARPTRWGWFAGGIASTAALAVAGTLWLAPRLEPARAPVATRVPATPAPPLASASAVEARPAPATEGTVRTGAGERLQLSLVGGTQAHLESSTVMKIDARGRATVDGGEVAFNVPRQSTGHSYVVFAGPYRVVVLGTKFRLRFDETRRVFVDVQDGQAEVWDHEQLAHLATGETWSSPPVANATTATRAHARTVAVATPGDDGSVDELEARAEAALAAGEGARALALYRSVAQRGGPAAENAAYEIGKILRDNLGQPAGAVAAWRRYRAEHPNGLLRVETDVSIIETLVHAGDASGALAEANEFIRNHPDSERRAEIARIAGDLYRTRADYKRAVTAYQTALASPLPRDAAEPATFHRAECLVRLGDPMGPEAARTYLRRWPNGRFRTEAERLLESSNDPGAARL